MSTRTLAPTLARPAGLTGCRGHRRQRGAIIITAALTLLLLLGFMGIALDFGRLFIVKTELQTTPDDALLWELRARTEAALGHRMAQHRSLGELYAIQGNFAASAEQLTLAQGAKDGDFFEMSAVDSRLREVRALLAEQMKERRER